MKKTKIVCTLGPSTDDIEVLRGMINAGMNVARLNCSHGSHEDHKPRIEAVKALREELNLPIALLLDTRGPEVRTGLFDNGKVTLVDGQRFVLTTCDVIGDNTRAAISYSGLPGDIEAGTRLLIDDGRIELRALEVHDTDIVCEVINGGVVTNRKSINVPGIHLNMPYISDKDRADIIFAIENDFDYIAASFVNNAVDLCEVQKILDDNGGSHILLIAKIENREGVGNIDEILEHCDGIMIARGDMGVEIDFEEMPVIQKMLIAKCNAAGKKVITATQMLESMTLQPRPTRAEISDVANAVYDGTSAIMLSGETAAGQYPVESVETMAKIATTAEENIHYVKRYNMRTHDFDEGITHAICHAACTTAHDLKAAAIVAVTMSGRAAYTLSSFRPSPPIISATVSRRAYYQMAMSWGVTPIMTRAKSSADIVFDHAIDRAVEEKLLSKGDVVVVTGGSPVGKSGTTNLMKVHIVDTGE